MAVDKAAHWLEIMLLNQGPADEAQWLQLVQECPVEGLHLDFKSGLELNKTEPASELEKYVAGFANSDGGILVFGYNEGAREFDGYRTPGGGPAVQWVSRVLQPRVGPYLSVQPRVVEGTVHGKPVFAVATARTAALVPVSRNGKLVIFLRIGDSTIPRPEYATIGAPGYLAGDLMLGRRAMPDLRLVVREASFAWHPGQHDADEAVTGLSVHVVVKNAGLLFADSVRYGMIAWTRRALRIGGVAAGQEVPDRLLMAVDAPQPLPSSGGGEWELRHFPARNSDESSDLGPFEDSRPQFLGRLSVPLVPATEVARIRAAMYVLSRNVEPRWHQFELRYDTSVPRAPAVPSQEAKSRCMLEVGVPRAEVSWMREPA